jgi:hypothetical protein
MSEHEPQPAVYGTPIRKTRRPWLAAGGAAALVLALAGGGYAALRDTGSDGGRAAPATSAPAEPSAQPPAEPSAEPTAAAAEQVADAPAAPGEGISFTAVGDIVMGRKDTLPPAGGSTYFRRVKKELTGDVVMGNLEGALTDTSTSSKCGNPPTANCHAFGAPASYSKWLKQAGFTILNLANNHSNDYGPAGLRETRTALDSQGIPHTGAPGQITMLTVKGVKIAVLGFAPYRWAQSLNDIDGAKALVKKAAADADLVVVTMHIGGEGDAYTHVRPGPELYLHENRGDALAFTHAVIDSGADLVVGHGPHVLRGMEWYKGRLIAHSMGNFGGYKVLTSTGPNGVSGILKVTLRKDGSWGGGTLVPTRLANRGLPDLDPARKALTTVRSLSAADFKAAAAAIGPDGTIQPPRP